MRGRELCDALHIICRRLASLPADVRSLLLAPIIYFSSYFLQFSSYFGRCIFDKREKQTSRECRTPLKREKQLLIQGKITL